MKNIIGGGARRGLVGRREDGSAPAKTPTCRGDAHSVALVARAAHEEQTGEPVMAGRFRSFVSVSMRALGGMLLFLAILFPLVQFMNWLNHGTWKPSSSLNDVLKFSGMAIPEYVSAGGIVELQKIFDALIPFLLGIHISFYSVFVTCMLFLAADDVQRGEHF